MRNRMLSGAGSFLAGSLFFGGLWAQSELDKDPLDQVREKIEKGALVVDVRTPDEYAEFHYPEAININVQEIESRVDEFGDKDQAIVVYCRSGRRSTRAKHFLQSMGYSDVLNAGGLEEIRSLIPEE